MDPKEAVDRVAKFMEYNYSSSTRVHNILAEREKSKRNRTFTRGCDQTQRKNTKRANLKKLLEKRRKREALEKLVKEHELRKAASR